MKSVFDGMHRAPVSKDAGMILASGTNYTPPLSGGQLCESLPLPTVEFSGSGENFTDRKFGRLTVIGLACKSLGKNGQRWVVKCVCGNYSLKKSKSLLVERDDALCCPECNYRGHMQWKERNKRAVAP